MTRKTERSGPEEPVIETVNPEPDHDATTEAFEEAAGTFHTAYELFDEIGAAPDAARAQQLEGVAIWREGDSERAETLVRETVRTLLSLQERGKIVEAQRTLAEIVLAQGHVEEAERWALSAVESVGMQDMMSRSNVSMVLGLVRAAQGRDAEAELLLRASRGDAIAAVWLGLDARDLSTFTKVSTELAARLERYAGHEA